MSVDEMLSWSSVDVGGDQVCCRVRGVALRRPLAQVLPECFQRVRGDAQSHRRRLPSTGRRGAANRRRRCDCLSSGCRCTCKCRSKRSSRGLPGRHSRIPPGWPARLGTRCRAVRRPEERARALRRRVSERALRGGWHLARVVLLRGERVIAASATGLKAPACSRWCGKEAPAAATGALALGARLDHMAGHQ